MNTNVLNETEKNSQISVNIEDSTSQKNPNRKLCTCEKCDAQFRSAHISSKAKYCPDCKPRKKHIDGEEGIDFITCPICAKRAKEFTGGHAKMHGFTNLTEFKLTHNLEHIKCLRTREKMMGSNNPGYQHGGKLSPFSKNFVGGYDADWHDEINKSRSEQMKTDTVWRENNPAFFEYWLKKTDGDETLAKELHLKSQTRNIEWFIEKYGETEGTTRYQDKTEKWIKSFKKQNFSMISQELFDLLISNIVDINEYNIYYATFDRIEVTDFVNKEYVLKTEKSYIRPDFICLNKKKIIEFDGMYWHSEAVANPAKEALRDIEIEKCGYSVLHVKEYDYKLNKEEVIKQCINFLKQ